VEHDHEHPHEPGLIAEATGGEVRHPGPDRSADVERLKLGLALLVAFMVVEVVAGIAAHSLALLSDAAHMLTDAVALAVGLVAARLVMRPAGARMTFGLGRAEILSAQGNALTMLVLAALIFYGGIDHLIHPLPTDGWPVLIVALVGITVNLVIVRVLGGHAHGIGHDHSHGGDDGHGHAPGDGHDHAPGDGHDHGRGDGHNHRADAEQSLNLRGSLAHIATDLAGFVVTAIAAVVILATGFRRADAIVSLMISAVMVAGGWPLLKASMRIMMEAAPEGLDPVELGTTLAGYEGVAEVHDLHVWEVTSGFPTLSAHIVVEAGHDCHQIRSDLSQLLEDRFGIPHSTLQVEHEPAPQPPMQIEVVDHA
jgi:cobalt-zinc-cadmium efflux system protein